MVMITEKIALIKIITGAFIGWIHSYAVNFTPGMSTTTFGIFPKFIFNQDQYL